ncbi:hypothetical protein GCM10009547_09260 [Sporichthya brevicatena]|uniref:Shikimate kinase n=1 Tax=Sporichthya brevicatena TaxID=171442 RepID=A0ABN1GDP0_9ACTN
MGNTRRIALVGLMGSGKTTVGEALAQRLAVAYLDNDRELIARFGETAAGLTARYGLDAAHAAEAAVLLDVLAGDGPAIVTAAASTIESAACRRALAERAFVVWLRADPQHLAARASAGAGRPWDVDVEAQLRAQVRGRHPLYERVADLTTDTSDLDPSQTVDLLVRRIRRRTTRPLAAVPGH